MSFSDLKEPYMTTAALEQSEPYRSVLVDIALGNSTSHEYMRIMAARALWAGQCSKDRGVAAVDITHLNADGDSRLTAKKLLLDGLVDYPVPEYYTNTASGRITFVWCHDPAHMTALFVGRGHFQLSTISDGQISVNIAYIAYNGGALPQYVANHIPRG